MPSPAPVDTTAYEQLDPRRHGDIRVGAGLAADTARLDHVRVELAEIADAACDHPLVAIKDRDSGRFHLVALLGLRPGRNLYVNGGRWSAVWLPRQIARAPFALTQAADGRLVPAIDLLHPRTNDPDGQPLFTPDGHDTPFLAAVRAMLDTARAERNATQDFLAALVAQRLLQPMVIDLGSQQGEVRLNGLYTIARDTLAQLPDAAVLALHRTGHLAAAQIMLASLAQLHRLRQLHDAHARTDPSLAPITTMTVGLPDG